MLVIVKEREREREREREESDGKNPLVVEFGVVVALVKKV